MRPIVLMLGTSPETKGGVSSVVKSYEVGGFLAKWPVLYLATHADGSWPHKLSTALSAWFLFARHLIFRSNFVLHVHTASRASFWRKSCFIIPAIWTRTPTIVHLHGGEFMKFYSSECGPLKRSLIRYIFDHCAEIIVLSESWRRAISTVTENPSISVIYNPSRTWWGGLGHRLQCGRQLLFLGQLRKDKGVYVLLEAFAEVLRHFPEAELVCAGDGDIGAVRGIIRGYDLEERVKLPGWVEDEQKAELLASSSVFVLPSYAEGLPMSILEAMSAGLPVVATPVGGIPEAVSDGKEGFLVPVGDVQQLADALCRLLGDDALRKCMGSQARATFAERFQLEVVLPQLEAIYRRLGVEPRGAS